MIAEAYIFGLFTACATIAAVYILREAAIRGDKDAAIIGVFCVAIAAFFAGHILDLIGVI
jgi:hypothetical protein